MAGNPKPSPRSIRYELTEAGERDAAIKATDKKNYAERLSRALAQRFANELRSTFRGILPDIEGKKHESQARSSKKYKKLDVNYSTSSLGLALGVSIKTINFRDAKSNRYTKNYTRADGELRAEASDFHQRQPWAVMVAIVFMPIDACDDGTTAPSSFGQAIEIFRFRGGRERPTDDPSLFEGVYIGLYDPTPGQAFGEVALFDVMEKPPRNGRPKDTLSVAEVVTKIVETYDRRNRPKIEWADAEPEPIELPEVDEAEDSPDEDEE